MKILINNFTVKKQILKIPIFISSYKKIANL